MKCHEFRDLSELLKDGALPAAEAKSARAHRDSCPSCRSFDEECAVLLAPFATLPPGPYLPPSAPGRLPPWAGGAALGVALAVLLAGGAAARALRAPARPEDPIPAAAPVARAPVPPARPPIGEPAPVRPAGNGVALAGRVLTVRGRTPLPGVAILVDGRPVATTDAAGVFRVEGLPSAGSNLLRLEPPGGPPAEALLPRMIPGAAHVLADLLSGPAGEARVRVVRHDARPGAGVRVRGCRLAPTVHPESQPEWRSGSRGGELPALASAETDAGGWARFEGLAPGTWTFQAEVDGRSFTEAVELAVEDGLEPTGSLFLDPAVPFEGRVVEDGSGEPVPGALVRWSREGLGAGSEDFRRSGETRTGADGGFRFAAVPALPIHFEVRRPGAPCPSGGLPVDAGLVDRADIRLGAVRTVSGICVVDGTGAPAAGVILRITVNDIPGDPRLQGSLVVPTGADGRFEAPGIPEGTLLHVGPHPGTGWFPCPSAGSHLPRDAGTWRVVVQPGAAIHGIVRDAGGRPRAGRTVVAYAVRRTDPGQDGPLDIVGVALSGGDGRFLLGNLPGVPTAVLSPSPADVRAGAVLHEARAALDAAAPPPWVVVAGAPGIPPVEIPPRQEEPSTAIHGESPPAVRIRGRVLDHRGAPVEGTRLLFLQGDFSPFQDPSSSFPLRALPGRPVPVADDGAFVLEVPESSSRGVSAPAPGAVSVITSSPRHPPSLRVLRPGGGDPVEGVDLLLEQGHALRGRVLRDDGTPAAGALLEAVPLEHPRSSGSPVRVEGRCADDGSFHLEGLKKGPHSLRVGREPGPVHAERGLFPGGPPVEVRLPPGGGVRGGRAPFPAGPPGSPAPDRRPAVAGRWAGLEAGRGSLARVTLHDPRHPWLPAGTATVDETGRFSGPAPGAGRFSVAVDLGGGRWRYADDIAVGTPDLVIPPAGQSPGSLQGRVVTPGGAPAAGVPVHAVLHLPPGSPAPNLRLAGRDWVDPWPLRPAVPGLVRTTLTAEDGTFDLGSPPGRWSVFAGLPGSGPEAPGAVLSWSSEDPRILELPLAPGRVLRAEGVDDDAPPDASPPGAAEVRLDGLLPAGAGPPLAVRIPRPPGGVFEFRGLPPGRCTVLLLDAGGREVGRAEAEPGEPGAAPVGIPLRR